MDLLKRWKKAAFTDCGLLLFVIIACVGAFSWSRFVDWGGPIDDMPAEERARLEDCIVAERSLGDSIYRERPDCRDILEPARIYAKHP